MGCAGFYFPNEKTKRKYQNRDEDKYELLERAKMTPNILFHSTRGQDVSCFFYIKKKNPSALSSGGCVCGFLGLVFFVCLFAFLCVRILQGNS